jgi:hypothetical protein
MTVFYLRPLDHVVGSRENSTAVAVVIGHVENVTSRVVGAGNLPVFASWIAGDNKRAFARADHNQHIAFMDR